MTTLIYNKPADTQTALESVEDMRKNPIVICADMDEYELYTPVRVKRARVRRETRRIRKASRRFSFSSAFFAAVFTVLIMAAVIYFSEDNPFAGTDLNSAEVFSMASESILEFAENIKHRVIGTDTPAQIGKGIPVYLDSSVPGEMTQSPQKVVFANGYVPPTSSAPTADLQHSNSDTADVSVQTKGKSGADGKVYLPLVSRNLSADNMLLLSNETKLSPDVQSLSHEVPKAYKDIVLTDKPIVLIVHTHATECYTSGTDGAYEKNEPTRSDNTGENVVAVGKALADTLKNFGIPVLHSETLHDKKSFLNAYTSSLNEVNRILGENPSIRFVIDLHRDAIESGSGEKTAPVTQIAGENYAQLMFVIGTNEAGFKHPDWEDNLCFALDMQKTMDKSFPGIMRPINLRSVSFNEQLSSGYVLLEAGASGNTLEEAKRSAEAFGTVLAGKILQNSGNK